MGCSTKDHSAAGPLFDFLEVSPVESLAAPFSKAPRLTAKVYFENYDEVEDVVGSAEGEAFRKYFSPDYDPLADTSWPALEDYRLDRVMAVKDNTPFRA